MDNPYCSFKLTRVPPAGALMPQYLSSHPNSSIVVNRVWTRDPQTVIRNMLEAFRKVTPRPAQPQ